MAELTPECCAPTEQGACCEPSEKATCCGTAASSGTCGCSAGKASAEPTDLDIREASKSPGGR